MRSLTLTLKIDFETLTNMDYARFDLQRAIQNRLFGEGVFDAGTLIDTWSSEIEVYDVPTLLKKVEITKKIRMKCSNCGSTDVKRDAWAEWDEEKQDWVLTDVYDNAFCCECAGECSINDEEIVEPCPDNCKEKI